MEHIYYFLYVYYIKQNLYIIRSKNMYFMIKILKKLVFHAN